MRQDTVPSSSFPELERNYHGNVPSGKNQPGNVPTCRNQSGNVPKDKNYRGTMIFITIMSNILQLWTIEQSRKQIELSKNYLRVHDPPVLSKVITSLIPIVLEQLSNKQKHQAVKVFLSLQYSRGL